MSATDNKTDATLREYQQRMLDDLSQQVVHLEHIDDPSFADIDLVINTAILAVKIALIEKHLSAMRDKR